MNYPARRIPVPEDGHLPLGEMEPGDYCGPITGYTGDVPAVFFLVPAARDEGAPGDVRAVNHVCFPPHTYRECADGSLEIRASIGIPNWHCWLDEGNTWRHP